MPLWIVILIIFINSYLVTKNLIYITNKIKNNYLFNVFLYYFLNFKNNLFGLIFEFIDFLESHPKKTFYYSEFFFYLIVGLFICFFLLNNMFIYYHFTFISFLVFIISLLYSIFGLIENSIIKPKENFSSANVNMDFIKVRSILRVSETSFKKNRNFYHLQRRYLAGEEVRTFLKRHATSLVTSGLAALGLNNQNKIQQEQLGVDKEQLGLEKRKFQYARSLDKKSSGTNYYDQFLKNKQEREYNYFEKIRKNNNIDVLEKLNKSEEGKKEIVSSSSFESQFNIFDLFF